MPGAVWVSIGHGLPLNRVSVASGEVGEDQRCRGGYWNR
jgi:hypothetical protein